MAWAAMSPFRYPPHLFPANAVQRFDPLKRPPRRVEGPKALTRSQVPLYGSMILFEDVVQIPYGSATTNIDRHRGPL
jgi:hypothetical protein